MLANELMNGSETLDELFEKGFEISLIESPKEDKEKLTNDFVWVNLFLKENDGNFGDFQTEVRKYENSTSVNFFSFAGAEGNPDLPLQGKLIKSTHAIGLTICDICEQKIACLANEEARCEDDENIRANAIEEVLSRNDYYYPIEDVVRLLKKEGFTERKLGDITLKNIFEKGTIHLYLE